LWVECIFCGPKSSKTSSSRIDRHWLSRDPWAIPVTQKPEFLELFQTLPSPKEHANRFGKCREVTALEANSDPNQIYELEARLKTFGILDQGEIDRFAETFYKSALDTHDRARLEGLVRQAVARFEQEDDPGRQEEFRQLVKSYMRFYSFVAQVVRLSDTGLEKLYSYSAWLSRLLPNRLIPPDIDITEDMLRLQAFRVEQKEHGSASLSPGDRAALKPISEFGAKPYTEDEERSLSEIIKAFNERHGTQFSRDDFIRFEQVNRTIIESYLSSGKSSAMAMSFAANLVPGIQHDLQFGVGRFDGCIFLHRVLGMGGKCERQQDDSEKRYSFHFFLHD
jgi:hypothetical protein